MPVLLPNRPPWRSVPHALNPSWTGSCGLWGRPTTLAASLVWCATVALTASRSQWMPPARSTALRTSTGQAGSPTLSQYVWPFLSSSSLVPASPVSHSCHALFLLTSFSSLRSKTITLAASIPSYIPPSLGSTVSPLQPWGLTTSLVPFYPRKFAPRCSVCGGAIMPEPGQEETVRIVALDRSFHIGCYKCEVRGPGQGVKEILEFWGCQVW